jgi:thiamine pyrophosphokinase
LRFHPSHFAALSRSVGGCTIAHDPSSNSTDFEKALRLVADAQASAKRGLASGAGNGGSALDVPCPDPQRKWTVIAFGAFGDRFDHEMASINVLHHYSSQFERLILMGERMTAELLPPGRHLIRPNPLIEGPTCGLLPVGGRCDAVWTSGLRWNLRGSALEFGGMVSSSNQLMVDERSGALEPVSITCTQPLVWTTVLRPEGWPGRA